MILFVYKNPRAECQGFSHVGLGISTELTVEYLNSHGTSAGILAVVDGYDLWSRLEAGIPGVTSVILQAPFFDTQFLRNLCVRFPIILFYVNYHSNIAFLGADNWSTRMLLEQVELSRLLPNFQVAGNCREFVESVGLATGEEIKYFPNLYPFHIVAPRPVGEVIRIGSFGAMRGLKNHTSSAWAVRALQRMYKSPMQLWINSGRCEGEGSSGIADNIRSILAGSPVKLVEVAWQSHQEFLNTVTQMDLLLQPSFTESFNIVTADGVAMGVPSVVGPAISWAPKSWKVNTDSTISITNKANHIINNKKYETQRGARSTGTTQQRR